MQGAGTECFVRDGLTDQCIQFVAAKSDRVLFGQTVRYAGCPGRFAEPLLSAIAARPVRIKPVNKSRCQFIPSRHDDPAGA